VAASVRTKHLMVQSMTNATSYRAGRKGTLKVGVFLGKKKTLGATTIEIKGPEGLEAEVKAVSGMDKAKNMVEVPFGFSKDAKKGSYDLEVTVTYTTQKGGKDKKAYKVTYTLPVTVE
jgi:hypothetical protein